MTTLIRQQIIALFSLTVLWLTPNATAQECDADLEEAMQSHAQKAYADVILHLAECQDRLLENSKKNIAYELLSQAYLAVGKPELAKSTLNKLLDLQPGYTPKPLQYSRDYIDLVDLVKQERVRRQKKSSLFRSKWFWISGAAASIGAVYLIFNDKSAPAELPEGPDPPDIQ
jgi:hypothetical protein